MTPLAVETHVRLKKVLQIRCPETGDAYAVCLVERPNGAETTMLACSTKLNLDHVRHLEGLEVNVLPTSNGLKLRPLDEQPEDTIDRMVARLEAGDTTIQVASPELMEDSASQCQSLGNGRELPINALSELIATTAEIAVKRGIPMAVWACLPGT